MGHQVNGKEETDNNVKTNAEHGAGEGPFCFGYFGGQKIDAHGVKNSFGAAA